MNSSDNILTIIQARTGSSRLPNKVLMPLAGKPLLVRMVQRVCAAKNKGRVVVATTTNPEDDTVVKICMAEGIEVFRGHPTDLLDRHYQAAKIYGASVVLKVPSDCPLIDPEVIDKVIARFTGSMDVASSFVNHPYDYVSNLHPGTWPDGNDIEVMSFDALENAWIHATLPHQREHTTPYLYENPQIFDLANVSWETGWDYSASHRWTIDYPEDYEFIKTVYDHLYSLKPLFGLVDILDLLSKNPHIQAINKNYAGQYWWNKEQIAEKSYNYSH